MENVDEEGLTVITKEDLEDAIAKSEEDELQKGISELEEAVEMAENSKRERPRIIRR